MLDTETISSFANGVYLDWRVSGDLLITFTAAGGASAVLNGLFLDPPPSTSATATFLKQDTTTQGSWIGVYGSQGYDIVSGPTSLPSYATVAPSGEATYTWSTTSSDPRALQVPGSSNRIAAVWYSGTSFTVAVDLTDGQSHDLELYFDDWDNRGRTEKVQLSDAGTGTVLDTESISGFQSGVYLDWKVSGDLLITLTSTGGGSAVLNGLFFDPPSGPMVVTAASPVISATTSATSTGITALTDGSTTTALAALSVDRRRHALPGDHRAVKENAGAKRARRVVAPLDKPKRFESHAIGRETGSISTTVHDLALDQIPSRNRHRRSED